MSDNPFDEFGKEFRRAMHARIMGEQMERAREQMHAAMEKAREDMERARAEFEEMMAEARRQMGEPRDWAKPDAWTPARKRKPPRRKPRGGEPAPVKPKPKPKPLVDGAEAPIE
jgi:hypothetical protein